jgi:hypothetical protein
MSDIKNQWFGITPASNGKWELYRVTDGKTVAVYDTAYDAGKQMKVATQQHRQRLRGY